MLNSRHFRVLFATLVIAAATLVLSTAAWADSRNDAALVMRNGAACTTCQFVVTVTPCTQDETVVVGTGSEQTVYVYFYDVITGHNDYPVVLNAGTGWGAPAGPCCPNDACYLTAWARYPCPLGGYQYAPTKQGWTFATKPNFWQTFTINTTQGCHTQNPATRPSWTYPFVASPLPRRP